MITHRNIIANVLQIREIADPKVTNSKEQLSLLTALPLYHIFALTVNSIFGYSLGMYNLLIANPSDTKAMLETIKKHPLSLITGVNTLYNTLLEHADFNKVNWSKLKTALSGGMALRESTAKKWRDATGVSILEGYGLTETSPCATFTNYEVAEFTSSVGIPLPSTEVIITDEHGNPLANGEVGEICIKGPQVMKGYWQQSRNQDSQIASQRWFRTGDIGHF